MGRFRVNAISLFMPRLIKTIYVLAGFVATNCCISGLFGIHLVRMKMVFVAKIVQRIHQQQQTMTFEHVAIMRLCAVVDCMQTAIR